MNTEEVDRNCSGEELRSDLVRSNLLVGPCANYTSQYGDPSELLSDCGLTWKQLENPESVIDTHKYLDAMARMEHSSEDMFLLQAGVGTPLDDLGLAGIAVQSASTLGDAIELTRQVLGYMQSSSTLEIVNHRGTCQLIYNVSFGGADEISPDLRYSAGIFANLICQGRNKYDPELKITCPGAKNVSLSGLPSNTKTRDGQTAIIEFDRRLLNSSMQKSRSDQAEILRRFLAANSINSAANLSMTCTVTELVRCSMGIAKPSQQMICWMLGVNKRSLQRVLSGEGTSFRQIVDHCRKSIAYRELNQGRSVTDTAFFLGYDHPQNLTTACYRWFGKSPSSI